MAAEAAVARPRVERVRRGWTAIALAAVLAVVPAASLQAAGWSEHLEPVPLLALGGALIAIPLAFLRAKSLVTHAIGLLSGLVVVTLVYSTFLSSPSTVERLVVFSQRVATWLNAASTGAASTDNLLFAYSMGLLAWTIGYVGGIGVTRGLNPWWAIVPSGAALLLNLSYSPQDMWVPFVSIHLLASIGLLVQATILMRSERWRAEAVAESLNPGMGYAFTAACVGFVILVAAWRIPAGDVQKGIASAWENVSGPWQTLQTNFDRMFAALNPSSLPGKGLTVAQTMAPRGSFELGDTPVLRISGREPGYWRAVTYDQYTGRAMTSSPTTSQRLERREPLEGSMDTEAGRKFSEYTVTLLAPLTSVIYAPDDPLTVSVPTVYDYRADRSDYGSLRPIAPIHEQQRYSVLASVSTAAASDLRQAGNEYPDWMKSYLQLPPSLPDRVRREARRVIGDATNPYDAAIAIQQFLRGMTYSTKVPVPPANRDWVSFLIFDSKEGYCDYFATAMTVMLRTVGVPARVASGYVTGDWDATTQSYIATEHHAHSWTEVYFPGYGWITFEPSANRPAPVRPETSPNLSYDPDTISAAALDSDFDDFYDDDEDLGSSGPINLPPVQTSTSYALIGAVAGLILLLLAGLAALVVVLWTRGIGKLPVVARPYAQVVRLASWCGVGPNPSQTPYEYGRELQRVVPSAGERIMEITDAYVAGIYGAKDPGPTTSQRLTQLGVEARRMLIRSLAIGRWRSWLAARLARLAGTAGRRAP